MVQQLFSGAQGVMPVRFRAYQVDRQGNILADLSAALQYGGQIDHDNDRAVARTLRCTLDAAALPASFSGLTPQTFNLQLNYEVYDGATWRTYPRGIFWLDQPQEQYTPVNTIWAVQGADLSYILSISTISTTYVVPAGLLYLPQVATIISNFGLKVGFDPLADTSLTPVAFVWAPNTSWLQICTDLLQGINYYPLQVDSLGNFVTQSRVTPAYALPAVTYTTSPEPAMILEPFHQTRGDLSQVVNQLKVIIDDPTRPTAFALLTNNDVNSHISVPNLGYTKSQEMRSSNGTKCVYNAAMLTTICAFELQMANARALPAELHTFPDPQREGNEFYTVSVDGVVVAQQYRVASWSMSLVAGGEMVHHLQRADYTLLTE